MFPLQAHKCPEPKPAGNPQETSAEGVNSLNKLSEFVSNPNKDKANNLFLR